ncbi:hypothetical protein, partial [Lacticaseibacillus paracasei]|uniref:hypothetical protein n=1 Tax=Lacticaseibacillus paracasei TaxID=1597 RepID=UPI002E3595F6
MILGIDGAKTRLGAAAYDADLDHMHARTFTPGEAPLSCARDVLTWIADLDAPISIVGAEQHAFSAGAKSPVDQGSVAWKLGWVSGVVAGVVAFDRRADLVDVPVSTWRAT